MGEMQIDDAPQKARDLFNKGFSAFERGNLDYAIDMLTACLQVAPGLLRARKFLRAAEVAQFKQKGGGALAHVVAGIQGLPLLLKARMQINAGQKMEALNSAEGLLRIDPLNARFLLVFGESARLAGLPEAGVQTLEVARDHHPGNLAIMKELGKLYQEAGRTGEARAIFEKLCALHPRDPSLIKALKDAMALDSMRKDGWNEAAETGDTYRKLIRDTKQAEVLEKEAKAVKTERDADALIAENLAKIEAEPENINYYRALARLYVQRKRFADALDALRKALDISRGDPEIDAAISRTRAQQFDHEIATLREAGDARAVEAKEQEKAQFIFDDTQDRVERYPTDLGLRFDWGVLLYENNYVNEAIQQFQMSQRNPQRRTLSLYYQGLCFKEKKQFDLAIEQLKKAGEGLDVMDDTKKSIWYELGCVAELMGDSASALRHFKDIYQVDIAYRDVAAKMEKAYGS